MGTSMFSFPPHSRHSTPPLRPPTHTCSMCTETFCNVRAWRKPIAYIRHKEDEGRMLVEVQVVGEGRAGRGGGREEGDHTSLQ